MAPERIRPLRSPATGAPSQQTGRRAPQSTGFKQPGSLTSGLRGTALPSQSGKLGENIPGFQTAFNSSGKGGGAFRSISENFSVNQATGTSSLSIPIHTSPARGNFGPQLQLSYDSGAGNGVFGFGWNVALPSISRKVNKGIPGYTDEDDISLGGKDIVPVLENDQKNTRQDADFEVLSYRPIIDSQTLRIERWTSRNDSDEVFWKTVSSENITSIYGDTESSCIFDSSTGRKRIFSWLLSRTWDAYGNAIEYSYKAEDANGISDAYGLPIWEQNRTSESRCRQKYIKRIKYGNRRSCRDEKHWEEIIWPSDWMFEVVFDYGEHPAENPNCDGPLQWHVRRDVFSRSNSGFEIRNYRICRRILMFHHFKSYGLEETLTASTVFTYDETSQRTALSTVGTHGFIRAPKCTERESQYFTESLPPWTFSYSTVPDPGDLEVLRTNKLNLIDVPGNEVPGNNVPKCTWLDLDGEGVPGLLSWTEGNNLLYQKHGDYALADDETQFLDPLLLREQPNISGGDIGRFGDLDRNGKIDYICVDKAGGPQGFYEREDSDSWSSYSVFPQTPRGLPNNEASIYVDLTGDGLDDMLLLTDGPQTLVWQKSLGKEGWSDLQRTYSDLSSRLPKLNSDSRTRSLVSDMTGDGLSDLVEVSSSSITYWLNLGHGKFGPAVHMENPPCLDVYGEPSLSRLTFIDVDGSGTSDIIYALPAGGAVLFYNLSGNCWSDGVGIPALWSPASSSSLFMLDILGKGTPSICWTEPSTSAQAPQINYIDLMGNTKPHILTSYQNGLGVTTLVEYSPSTKFSRADKANGQPWTTKLPFPVQCVSRIEMHDAVTGNRVTTEHKYHNGCYDSEEREFAGFEMVEQFHYESIVVGGDETYEAPVLHTKSWFNVGLALDVDEKHFCNKSLVRSTLKTLDNYNHATSLQALRGVVVRTEMYGLDGSDKEVFPYQVQELSYDVEQIQSQSINAYPVTQMTPRESLTHNFERDIHDPQLKHEIVLSKNKYGNVEESLIVVYPREPRFAASEFPDVEENHKAGNVTFLRTQYTNAVDEKTQVFQKPQPCRHRDYEILNFPFTGKLLDVDDMRVFNFKALEILKQSSIPWKTLRSDSIVLYKDSLLKGVLGVGLLQPYSTIYRSYSLAFTTEMLTKLKQGREACGITGDFDDILEEGGYVSSAALQAIHEQGGGTASFGNDFGQQGDLWAPSPVAHFVDTTSVDKELETARRTFWIPTISCDAMGSTSKLELDEDCMLAKSLIDGIGNKITFVSDYEHLQPCRIIDANDNAQDVVYDALGRIIAIANVGKGDAAEDTDSLDDFQTHIDPRDIHAVLNNPEGESTKRLLGNSGSRIIHCFGNLRDQITAIEGDPSVMVAREQSCLPCLTIDISRDFSFRHSIDCKLRVEVTYLNGFGSVVQRATLNDPYSSAKKWLISGISATSVNGNDVRNSQPFYAASPSFVAANHMPEYATTVFYDVVGRPIGALCADHTWTKTIFTPWARIEHGVGSNCLLDSPQSDLDLGHYFLRIKSTQYLPTWHQANTGGTAQQQLSAAKSAVYNNTPLIVHFGNCGLPLRQVRQVGNIVYTNAHRYDFAGNKIKDFDNLNRLIEHNMYDKMQRGFLSRGMDNGDHWSLLDVQGQTLLTWDSRGTCFSYKYDALRREIEKCLHVDRSRWMTIIRTLYGDKLPGAKDANLKGRVFKVQNQAGLLTSVKFDIRGQCTEQLFQPALEYKSTLDWAGQVSLENSVHINKAKFDNFGQPIWEADPSGSQTRRTFSRTGHGQTVDHYDKESLICTPFLMETQFSADGLPLKAVYGNSTTTDYTYEDASRYLMLQTTSKSGKSARTDIIEKISHTYDCEGRLIRLFDASEQEVYFRDCHIQPEQTYSYDAIGQLISATGRGQLYTQSSRGTQLEPSGLNTGSVAGQGIADGNQLYRYEETYQYDPVGNLLTMKHAASEDSSISGWTRKYVYQEPSLLSEELKIFGNRLSKTSVGSKEENYDYSGPAGRVGCITTLSQYSRLEWDMNNMLSTSSRQVFHDGTPEMTYYVYDHTGARVRKITEGAAGPGEKPRKQRDTFYLNGLELQIRFKGDGIQTRSVRQIHKVTGEELLTLVESVQDSTAPALLRFQIGKNLELDNTGKLISYEEYSPFGSVTYSAKYQEVEAPRKYRFARYEHDTETGLYHCGARYYCPWLGRWLSPDPLGGVDGPNLYAYVNNDPINWKDPDGTSGQQVLASSRLITTYKTDSFHGKVLNRGAQSNSNNKIRSRKTTLTSSSIKDEKKPGPERPPSQSDNQVQEKSAHVKKAAGHNARHATANWMHNIKSTNDVLTHRDMVKDALRKEHNVFKRAWLEHKGAIARKAAVLMIAEAVSFTPIIGALLKGGINLAASQWEKKRELEKRKNEDLELIAFALTHGKENATRELESQIADIGGRIDDKDRGDALDQIVTYGVSGALEKLNEAQKKKEPAVADEDLQVEDVVPMEQERKITRSHRRLERSQRVGMDLA